METQVSNCPHCQASLLVENSVARTYISKVLLMNLHQQSAIDDQDDDAATEDVVAHGHYENDVFVSDSFEGFGNGRFDLADDSDTCTACDGQL